MISGILMWCTYIGTFFNFALAKMIKFDFTCQTTFAAVLLMNKAFQINLLTGFLSFHQSVTKNQNKKKCVFLLLSQFQQRIMASSLFKL